MGIHIGDTAPDFTADTSAGKISFHDWIGDDWVFFFSHPGDFTPVCTTEIGRTAQLADEFAKRHVKPLGLSTDGVEEHLSWIEDVNDTQHTTVKFPIVADSDSSIARLYEMIHANESATAAVRSVFIIDPNKKIRLTMTYPMNVGRNFDEILRVIDALQTGDANKIATPADWLPGGTVIIPPSIKDAEAKTLFPQGWTELRPYLRTTKI
ncbi:peroxiredoxin [Devosia sp.]|uniref:peroxiredoxin n=1 Tax=Devosia sp. TaxID=1871048 RepID=UPI00273446C3|nr:peroxiredoxin [Devosia sp.]MDP2781574.1 peroxiredoxin [Devosia sp.]